MKDKTLKDRRLIFYREDIEQINKLLKEFIKLSGSKCTFLIDKEGHLVTQEGPSGDINPETLSALIAGSFAATKEMAKILGETEFSVIFHEGKKDHIHISLAGDIAILAVLFDDTTTIGMVRLYAKESIEKIEKIFEATSKKEAKRTDPIDDNFSNSARAAINNIFDE